CFSRVEGPGAPTTARRFRPPPGGGCRRPPPQNGPAKRLAASSHEYGTVAGSGHDYIRTFPQGGSMFVKLFKLSGVALTVILLAACAGKKGPPTLAEISNEAKIEKRVSVNERLA